MNKKDIVGLIADATGSTRAKATLAFDRMVAAITEAIKKDGYAKIQDLCSFSLVRRAARSGRNPRTGEVVPIEEKVVVKIKPLQALKNAVEK